MFGRITLAGIWIGFGSFAGSRVGENSLRNRRLQEAFGRLWSVSSGGSPGIRPLLLQMIRSFLPTRAGACILKREERSDDKTRIGTPGRP